jgi:hypothetical protein
MPEIVRKRTIRPSTRKATSVNYRVDIKGIGASDTLIVEISHESRPFHKVFKFRGRDVLQKKSLGFTVNEKGHGIDIQWISTQPVNG